MLLLTVLLVCYPFPGALLRHLERWSNLQSLITPDAPGLEALSQELDPEISSGPDARAALAAVEELVYRRLPYAWDWETWGVADYIPTVEEALAKGREDCDGRAVVAASLLARQGFHVELVSDFSHVWVRTEAGETMSPGQHAALVATEEGPRLRPGALLELLDGLGLGVAVFPWPRELIVVLVAWALLLGRGRGWGPGLLGLGLLVGGLLLLRAAAGPAHPDPVRWRQWTGLGVWILALVLLSWVPPARWQRQSGKSRAAS